MKIADDGTIPASSLHGDDKEEVQRWLQMSTQELFDLFAAGGKEGQVAAMEFTRRKRNKAVNTEIKRSRS